MGSRAETDKVILIQYISLKIPYSTSYYSLIHYTHFYTPLTDLYTLLTRHYASLTPILRLLNLTLTLALHSPLYYTHNYITLATESPSSLSSYPILSSPLSLLSYHTYPTISCVSKICKLRCWMQHLFIRHYLTHHLHQHQHDQQINF